METDYEKEIKLSIYNYYLDHGKTEKWYKTPHKLLSDFNKSPKQLVDEGRGKEVLEWVRMVLNR